MNSGHNYYIVEEGQLYCRSDFTTLLSHVESNSSSNQH